MPAPVSAVHSSIVTRPEVGLRSPESSLEHLVRRGSGGGDDPDDRAGRGQRGGGAQRDAGGERGGDALEGETGRSVGCRPRRIRRQHDAVGKVEHVVEPLLACGRQLDVADPWRQGLEPAHRALDVQEGGRDAGQVLPAHREREDDHDDEAGERRRMGREDQAADDDALLMRAVLDHLGQVGEPCHLPGRQVQAADRAGARDGLVHVLAHAAERAQPLLVGSEHPAADASADEDERDGGERHRDAGLPLDHGEQDQADDEPAHAGEAGRQGHLHRARDPVDVRRQAHHDRRAQQSLLAEGPAAEHAIEHPGAQDEGGLVRDRVRAQVRDVGDGKEEDDEPEQHADQDGIPVPVVKEDLDDPRDQRLAGQDHEGAERHPREPVVGARRGTGRTRSAAPARRLPRSTGVGGPPARARERRGRVRSGGHSPDPCPPAPCGPKGCRAGRPRGPRHGCRARAGRSATAARRRGRRSRPPVR